MVILCQLQCINIDIVLLKGTFVTFSCLSPLHNGNSLDTVSVHYNNVHVIVKLQKLCRNVTKKYILHFLNFLYWLTEFELI